MTLSSSEFRIVNVQSLFVWTLLSQRPCLNGTRGKATEFQDGFAVNDGQESEYTTNGNLLRVKLGQYGLPGQNKAWLYTTILQRVERNPRQYVIVVENTNRGVDIGDGDNVTNVMCNMIYTINPYNSQYIKNIVVQSTEHRLSGDYQLVWLTEALRRTGVLWNWGMGFVIGFTRRSMFGLSFSLMPLCPQHRPNK